MLETSSRFFAIVPSAGRSNRMGRPKLVLPWRGRPILEHVLAAWRESRVTRTIVVARQDDDSIAHICSRLDVDLVCPAEAPEQMKHSVQFGLQHVAATYQPGEGDYWLLAPADMPKLNSHLIDQVIAVGERLQTIVVPVFGNDTGHPVFFPWRTSKQILDLKEDEGINRLVANSDAHKLELPASLAIDDVDTMEDYLRLPV